MLTHGSLFSGYGGLDIACEEVFSARTAWVSDIDNGACKILAHRYPGVPNLGDITKVDWATVEPVDIISGGSPCQDLSHAGRRAGMTEGTRSNLWVSMREAIATIRPTYVIWENVHGALSANASSALEHCPGCMGDPRHGGPVLRALGRVLGDLADLGFDAEWHGLRAADVGACHGRFRVFVLAYVNDARLQGQQDQAEASPAERHGHAFAGAGGPDLTLLPTPRAQARESPYARDDYHHNLEEWVGHYEAGTLHTLTDATVRQPDRWGDYAAAIASHERLTGRPAPAPTEPGPKGNPRLSAAFTEWLMMLPAGWITDVPSVTRTEALRACGNGVVPQQAMAALQIMRQRAKSLGVTV